VHLQIPLNDAAQSRPFIRNYISPKRNLSSPCTIQYTQNQSIGRGRLASDRQRNNQALPCRTLNARTQACMHAFWFAWWYSSPHIHMSMLHTCRTYVPESALFVTTARAESERADRTTEKHGCLHSSKSRRVNSSECSNRGPMSHFLAALQSDARQVTRNELATCLSR